MMQSQDPSTGSKLVFFFFHGLFDGSWNVWQITKIFVMFQCIGPQWIQHLLKDVSGSPQGFDADPKLFSWKHSRCFVSEVSFRVERSGWKNEHPYGVLAQEAGEKSPVCCFLLESWYPSVEAIMWCPKFLLQMQHTPRLRRAVIDCLIRTHDRIALLFRGKILKPPLWEISKELVFF